MVGYFFEALYDVEKKYLLQFGDAIFPMLIQFITLPLHVVLVSNFSKSRGLYGIGMATNISFFSNFVVLHIYLTLVTKEPYRFSLFFKGAMKEKNKKQFRQTFRDYIRLGVPSTLMTYFDFWIYTVLLFCSIYLGILSNAAQLILFNITSCVYAVGIGFGQAVCTKVGNSIGKG